jgi:hypothetical protein
MYKGQCVPKCPAGQAHTGDDGTCKTPCDLSKNDMYRGQCVPKCPSGQVHTGSKGACQVPCDLSTHEIYRGQCVLKCTSPQIRLKNGQCGLIFNPKVPLKPLTPVCDTTKNDIIKGQCVPKTLNLQTVPKIDKGGPIEQLQVR